jgi:hypothetical protein
MLSVLYVEFPAIGCCCISYNNSSLHPERTRFKQHTRYNAIHKQICGFRLSEGN